MSAITCEAIAARHELTRRARSWRGTCPACQYAGSGTFSMKPGRDGTPLLYCSNGCPQEALNSAVGREPPPPDPRRAHDQAEARSKARARALAMWQGSAPVPGTLAAGYLESRCIGFLAGSEALRFRADCWHPEGGRLPALIALVTDAAGAPMAIHRTYLDRATGGKARIEPAKATLGSPWGGAVRLAPVARVAPCDDALAVGEGVETAAAAGKLLGLPAWSALNAGNLARAMALPASVRAVTIAVDRDPAGERAALHAAARWRAEGRLVRCLLPDQDGQDAADVLRAREAHHG